MLVLAAAAASGASAATPNAKGIDVSHWQGKIQWPRVAAAGYTFAFGKATESTTYTDPTYATNRTGAESAGLTFGAYHFGRPGGSGDAGIIANAIAQADYFLDVAQPQAGELPPVLDLETKGALAVAGAAEVDARVARPGRRAHRRRARSSTRRRASGRPRSATRWTSRDAGYPLWIAHWTTNASPLVPAEAWGGRNWTFWQHSSHGTVPGITPQVDLDRFRGADASVAAIRSYPTGLPQASAVPTIVGTAQTGKTLAAVPGAWAGGKPLVFAYQWQRCDAAGAGCAPIVGATAETYLPATDDVGHALTVAVTAQSTIGTASATSPADAGGLELGLDGHAPGRDVGADRQRHAAGRPDAVAHRRPLDRLADRVHLSMAALLDAVATPVRRDRRRDGVDVHAHARRHRRDDLAVVTATGRGGSTSAPAPTTADGRRRAGARRRSRLGRRASPALRARCRPPTGSATVTWQPGAVPAGSTVSLATLGPRPASRRSPPPSRSFRGPSTSPMPRRRPASSARRRTTRSGASPRIC